MVKAITTNEEVRRLQRAIASVERTGATIAAKQTRALNAAAIKAFENRGMLQYDSRKLLDTLANTMTRIMAVANYLGKALADARTPKYVQQRPQPEPILRLDLLDTIVRNIGLKPIEIADIQDVFEKIARQATNTAIDRLTIQLNDTVRKLVSERATFAAARKAIRGVLNAGQIGDNAAGSSAFINTAIRTQTQLAQQAGSWQRANEVHSLWGFMYSTAGDERVREEHVALDGTTLPKNHYLWDRIAPPNGWNCRCFLIPIFDAEPIALPKEGWAVDPAFNFNPGQTLATQVASSEE